MVRMIYLLMLTASVRAVAVTKFGIEQFQTKKLVRKVVALAPASASLVASSLCPSQRLTHARESREPSP